ncbi:MAG: preprotein translocase subunit SecE [Ruminococcaceae bacterium]|nr:preprotein translocase subunit SecE [Oscillospiraceae bacterium]
MAETKQKNFFQRTGKKIAKWFREMKSELKKVTWPTRKQLINNTIVALTVMIIVAIVVFGFDWCANRLAELLISISA